MSTPLGWTITRYFPAPRLDSGLVHPAVVQRDVLQGAQLDGGPVPRLAPLAPAATASVTSTSSDSSISISVAGVEMARVQRQSDSPDLLANLPPMRAGMGAFDLVVYSLAHVVCRRRPGA